ncbi:hypothetical protein C8R41DRAFT_867387 [Lentinula lateritia]|uniref:Uncharacterized protein n=1 Tax=Lentinula lateritia TaxID=40482 RepID=A0ABQ8VKG5_9AGAR|nr:hypothetical protein C8R41DRAFT_867387 [Lentinula lateritia]
MSNQSDRPSTPDYQCDMDNIESRPIASSSNTLSQADRPGFVMSSQTDSGVESKLVVIDTGNITDKDSEALSGILMFEETGMFYKECDRGDVRNLFPTVFVWTTVFIGVSLTVLISWELVAFVMGIYT